MSDEERISMANNIIENLKNNGAVKAEGTLHLAYHDGRPEIICAVAYPGKSGRVIKLDSGTWSWIYWTGSTKTDFLYFAQKKIPVNFIAIKSLGKKILCNRIDVASPTNLCMPTNFGMPGDGLYHGEPFKLIGVKTDDGILELRGKSIFTWALANNSLVFEI